MYQVSPQQIFLLKLSFLCIKTKTFFSTFIILLFSLGLVLNSNFFKLSNLSSNSIEQFKSLKISVRYDREIKYSGHN